jgi:hypothetical protein
MQQWREATKIHRITRTLLVQGSGEMNGQSFPELSQSISTHPFVIIPYHVTETVIRGISHSTGPRWHRRRTWTCWRNYKWNPQCGRLRWWREREERWY